MISCPTKIRSALFVCAIAACLIAGIQSVRAAPGEKILLVVPLYAADVPLEPTYVARLSAALDDDDIVVAKANRKTIGLVRKVRNGKVAVIRQSLADLEKDISVFRREGIRIDYICYNPESYRSSHTTEWEKTNIVEALKKARLLADENGAGLIVVPDTKELLPTHGAEMARYADIVAIQFQRFQTLSSGEFRKKVRELASAVRTGSPNVRIVAQISTNPPVGWKKGVGKIFRPASVEEMITSVEAVRDLVDGVGFLIGGGDDGLDRLERTVRNIKKR